MVLYHSRVEAPIFASFGAALSAMALQFTVGRAVVDGVIKDRLPFVRTTKGAIARSQYFPALWEAVLGGLLLLGALMLHRTNENQVREVSIFSAVLFVQSLPFLAAVGMALVERSRLNTFATWRRLRLAADLSATPAAWTSTEGRAVARWRSRHHALRALSLP